MTPQGAAPAGDSMVRHGESAPDSFAPLRIELEHFGNLVVPHGADLCVRLPLLCSVRLRAEGDRVRFIPKFGPFTRSASLLVTLGASTALVAGTALGAGLGPGLMVATFVGIAALAVEACRFMITEGCMTRIQQLLLARRGDRGP